MDTVSYRLPNETKRRLDKIADEMGISRTDVCRLAVGLFINRGGVDYARSVLVQAANDDSGSEHEQEQVTA